MKRSERFLAFLKKAGEVIFLLLIAVLMVLSVATLGRLGI